jgi:hypothetical protein
MKIKIAIFVNGMEFKSVEDDVGNDVFKFWDLIEAAKAMLSLQFCELRNSIKIARRTYVRLTDKRCSWYEPIPQPLGIDLALLVDNNHRVVGVEIVKEK